MLLGVKPLVFLAKLLVVFALTYLLWEPFAPIYTRLLAACAQAVMSFTELFAGDTLRGATRIFSRGNGIFFTHKLFPGIDPPGIPADWVQANMVLLIPLMLATPAATWLQRFGRLALALGLALFLQVIGLVIAIKATWATQLGMFSAQHYGNFARTVYEFTDAFFQSFDTQLFPVAIWAGIHFRSLIQWVQPSTPTPATSTKAPEKSRAERRRRERVARGT